MNFLRLAAHERSEKYCRKQFLYVLRGQKVLRRKPLWQSLRSIPSLMAVTTLLKFALIIVISHISKNQQMIKYAQRPLVLLFQQSLNNKIPFSIALRFTICLIEGEFLCSLKIIFHYYVNHFTQLVQPTKGITHFVSKPTFLPILRVANKKLFTQTIKIQYKQTLHYINIFIY